MIAQQSYSKPRTWSPVRLWWRRRLQNWPFLLWIALAMLVVALYQRSAQFGHMVGVVETLNEPVAPMETARLKGISVAIGQRVKAGEAVAQMDAAQIDDEISISRAELAEAEDTITGYQQNLLQMAAQSERSLKDAETSLSQERALLASQTAELQALLKEQERREALFAQKLINERDVAELRPKIAALQTEIALRPEVVARCERYVETAGKQVKDLNDWLRLKEGQNVTAALEGKMKARNAIIASTIAMLENRAKSYTLRATRDGMVSQILYTPGDVVNSGMPVLHLVAEHPVNVIGFLPEIHLADMNVGQKALVWRTAAGSINLPATVVSIAPDVRDLPGRLNTLPAQQLRGRRVILRLDAQHDFVPGETVEIGLARRSWREIVRDALRWRPFK